MTIEKATRLGRRELGPFAFETHMPAKVAALIQDETSVNQLRDIIPILADLLERSSQVERAYLCQDNVVQIYKLKGEGGHFCGYRNLQMMLPSIPTIPDLQQMIERAWDAGFNTHGRVETGGIIGTRKHIGSSEVEALLLYRDLPCAGRQFTGFTAWAQLLDVVEYYYASTSTNNCGRKVLNAVNMVDAACSSWILHITLQQAYVSRQVS